MTDKPLYPHQAECVARGRDKSLAMFLEMGLGKTRSVLECIPLNAWLSVVICPISAHKTWINEVELWRPDINVYTTIGMTPKKRRYKRETALFSSENCPTILVINYEQVVQTLEFIKARRLNLYAIVADESSYIKNSRAQRTKAALAMRKKAKVGYALSGTPVLHGPIDLYSQMKFVDGNIFPESYWSFRNRYAVMGGFEGKQIISYKRTDDLLNRIKPHAIAIKKEDVAVDLPPKIYETRNVELSTKEMKHYKLIKKEAVMSVGRDEVIPITNALAKISKLAQASCGFAYYESATARGIKRKVFEVGRTKRKAAIDLVVNGDLAGQPCIIWTVFVHELIQTTLELENLNIKVASALLQKTHIKAADVFISDNADVLVANPASLGYGINLQKATAVIFLSNSYKYGDRVQAEARSHRIGQTKPVTVVDIVADKTIDNKILNVIRKKESIAEMIRDELGIEITKE